MEPLTAFASSNNPTTFFVFSQKSTTNAAVVANDWPRYKISTTDSQLQHTRVIDAITEAELASIRRKIFGPDTVTFVNHHGGAEQKVKDVVQKSKTEDGYPIYVIHTRQGDFHWKIDPVHLLSLVSASDPGRPIAYRERVLSPRPTFGLVIQNRYREIVDYIITTFLLVEVQLGKKIGLHLL